MIIFLFLLDISLQVRLVMGTTSLDRENAAGLVTGVLVEESKLNDDGLNSVFSLSRVITTWFRYAVF